MFCLLLLMTVVSCTTSGAVLDTPSTEDTVEVEVNTETRTDFDIGSEQTHTNRRNFADYSPDDGRRDSRFVKTVKNIAKKVTDTARYIFHDYGNDPCPEENPGGKGKGTLSHDQGGKPDNYSVLPIANKPLDIQENIVKDMELQNFDNLPEAKESPDSPEAEKVDVVTNNNVYDDLQTLEEIENGDDENPDESIEESDESNDSENPENGDSEEDGEPSGEEVADNGIKQLKNKKLKNKKLKHKKVKKPEQEKLKLMVNPKVHKMRVKLKNKVNFAV